MGEYMKDDYTVIKHKKASLQSKNDISDKKIKYLKNLITRTLLSIILIISISIISKVNSDNNILLNEYIFKDSLKFTQINNWYQEKLGNILPNTKDNSELVFGNSDLKTASYEEYLNGVKFSLTKSSPVTLLNGGIVVFIGDEEGYDKTVIIQGNDGIDYWYGGLTNININLYDYLEKDTLIGECANDYLYLVLQKGQEYLKYDEYIKQNKD